MESGVEYFKLIATGLGLYYIYNMFTLIRRERNLMYGPLYFAVYPLASLNRKLGDNFDDLIGPGTRQDTGTIRRSIAATGCISFAIDAFFLPFIFGLILGATVSGRELFLFICFFMIIRVFQIIRSLKNLPDFSGIDCEYYRGNFFRQLIYLLYGWYFILAVTVFWRTYDWARPYFERDAYVDLIRDGLD